MRAIFLADAHLRYPQDKNYQHLLTFLKGQKDLDGLFLLGDIFEFWLGYRHLVFSAYVPLLEALWQLTQNGTRLFYVEGNHDFNLGAYFSTTLNATVIPEQQVVTWDNQRILLCHGDLLKPTRGYRTLRRFWRSRPAKLLARLIHPDLVWPFALWLSDKSPRHQGSRPPKDPTSELTTLIEQPASEDVDLILCGHFHHPTVLEHGSTKVIALGDWIKQFSYAEMYNGEINLRSYAG